jgi:hypothetical protein
MPVLHRYRNDSGAYVLANVKGAVVTFQVTRPGVKRLQKAGVLEGVRFPLALLVDLTRRGDAFTRAKGTTGGPSQPEIEQFLLPLDHEEPDEALLPVCAETGSVEDLHLVVWRDAVGDTARILCEESRLRLRGMITLSVPLRILTLHTLKELEASGKLPAHCDATQRLHRWLQADLSGAWKNYHPSDNGTETPPPPAAAELPLGL